MAERTVQVTITGRVQAVGFRAWTEGQAAARGLSGWVRNRADGAVEAVFSGDADAIEAMIAACRVGPPAAKVDAVTATESAERPTGHFTVRPTC
jgi:acylphosphatase